MTKMPAKRLIGIDYGTKHCGIAYTEVGGPVFPYKVVPPDTLEMHLNQLITIHSADTLILGLPLSTDGSENILCQAVKKLGRRLQRQLDLPVDYVDERFSSKSVVTNDQKKRIDDQAAAQILEYYVAQY